MKIGTSNDEPQMFTEKVFQILTIIINEVQNHEQNGKKIKKLFNGF